MDVYDLMAFIALGLLSLLTLFIVEIPVIVFVIYCVRITLGTNVVLFLLRLFYYIILIISINMVTAIFIPPLIFRVFRIRPKEGEYDLRPTNPQVFKWYLSLSLYKISMIFGRVSHITRALVVRLFGGKVGRNVYLQGHVTEPYFVEIGEYTVIGDQAKIFTHIADRPGKIIFRRVQIGSCCLIGYGSLIMPGSRISDYTIVGAYAIVPKNSFLESGVWVGAPARKIKEITPELIRPRETRQERSIARLISMLSVIKRIPSRL